MSVVTPERAADLVGRAAGGDQAAWDQLVDDLTGLLWSVARSHGLEAADAADVVQTAWLRLAENLGRLHEPSRVSAWLVTTARRESLRLLRGRRDIPVGVEMPAATATEPDDPVLRAERDERLWGAFSTLPSLCRSLLRVLMADPPPTYVEVSAALDMPVGSIGPRRARCLQRLRNVYEDPTEVPRCEP